ncbi:MAG: hypothetical protein JNM56_07905 [Planctomycetia bacterium]|nr:hypothetical protein [Planctomycetia bacterium]
MSAADWAARCLECFHHQQYAESDALARRGLADFPDDGLLWQLHGAASWFLGDLAAARRALETAQTLAPLQPLSRCALAGAYSQTGDSELARALYVSLLQDDRCPSSLLPKVATGLGRLGEYWTALQVCRKLARLQPTHHAAYFGLAYYMAKLDYPSECYLRHLVRAHQLAPELLPYRINLAMLLADLGRAEHAHRLIRELPAAAIACTCWLHRLIDLCDTVGDDAQGRAFRERLDHLLSCPGSNS